MLKHLLAVCLLIPLSLFGQRQYKGTPKFPSKSTKLVMPHRYVSEITRYQSPFSNLHLNIFYDYKEALAAKKTSR